MLDADTISFSKKFVEKLFDCVIPDSTMQRAAEAAETIIKRWKSKQLPTADDYAISRVTSGEILAEAHLLAAADGEGKAKGLNSRR